jgi:hypothetical protein
VVVIRGVHEVETGPDRDEITFPSGDSETQADCQPIDFKYGLRRVSPSVVECLPRGLDR